MDKTEFEYQPKVFKEAVIYIYKASATPSLDNNTVMQKVEDYFLIQKILYYSDFDYYELYEKPITGESYKRMVIGVQSIHLKKVVAELIESGDFEKPKENYKYLTESEKRVLDETINEFIDVNKSQNRLIYYDMPFKITKLGEIIDYEFVFYRNDEYSKRKY